MDRRQFIANSGTGLAAAAVLGLPALAGICARVNGASSRLRVAVVGTNSRGLAHIAGLAAVKNTEIVAICDVDDAALVKGMAEAVRWQKKAPKPLKDFRNALDDPTIDAITIATPDHWHAPMAILALAAGKHVWVETPGSHNPREGELLMAAAAKYRRFVQVGNPWRSATALRKLVRLIGGGAIGRTRFARAWYASRHGDFAAGSPARVSAGLDCDLWQGPAPRRSLGGDSVHTDWRWSWDWSTGPLIGNGMNLLDICRWALQVGYPHRVSASGGRYQMENRGDIPDTHLAHWEFSDGRNIAWEGRCANAFPVEDCASGAMIYGTEGTALVTDSTYMLFEPKGRVMRMNRRATREGRPIARISWSEASDPLHFQNFADAIREGAALNAPIHEMNASATMLHLANIAWRTGRELRCDPANGRIPGDDDAMKLWSRTYAPGWEPVV